MQTKSTLIYAEFTETSADLKGKYPGWELGQFSIEKFLPVKSANPQVLQSEKNTVRIHLISGKEDHENIYTIL